MTYREALQEGEALLRDAGIEEAGSDAWLFLEHAFGITRGEYLLHKNEPCSLQKARGGGAHAYRMYLQQRAQRIPLQHILGEAWFCGFPFLVSGDVLIPRQETELLAEEALRLTQRSPETNRILDLCTGSGCLAVVLALRASHGIVEASDCSEKALAVARKNAQRLGAKVRFLQGDLFEAVSGKYHLIVSNPPYIKTGDLESLMPEVRDHDPRLALDGGEDGLMFYRRIIREAPSYLTGGGALALEIGHGQGDAVTALMEENGFGSVRLRRDLAGLERVVSGILQETDKNACVAFEI